MGFTIQGSIYIYDSSTYTGVDFMLLETATDKKEISRSEMIIAIILRVSDYRLCLEFLLKIYRTMEKVDVLVSPGVIFFVAILTNSQSARCRFLLILRQTSWPFLMHFFSLVSPRVSSRGHRSRVSDQLPWNTSRWFPLKPFRAYSSWKDGIFLFNVEYTRHSLLCYLS